MMTGGSPILGNAHFESEFHVCSAMGRFFPDSNISGFPSFSVQKSRHEDESAKFPQGFAALGAWYCDSMAPLGIWEQDRSQGHQFFELRNDGILFVHLGKKHEETWQLWYKDAGGSLELCNWCVEFVLPFNLTSIWGFPLIQDLKAAHSCTDGWMMLKP